MEKKLDHKIGLIQCIAYVVGNMIGSGIFITPVAILAHTGSVGLSLTLWALCGALSILGGLCFIELGTSIPESGAEYSYICYVGWQLVAFSLFWDGFILYNPSSNAIFMKTAGSYIVEAISPLICFDPASKQTVALLCGFMIMAGTIYVNFLAIDKFAGNMQVVLTIFKVIVLTVVIATGLYYIFAKGQTQFFEKPFQNSKWEASEFTTAIYAGLWAYDGWYTLNFGVDEIKNPERNLVIGTIVGVLSVTVIYLLVISSYIAVMGPKAMLDSNAVAASFSQMSLGNVSYAIPLIIVIVMMGSLNAQIFTSSRLYQVVARKGHLPSFMALLNVDTNSPQTTLIYLAVTGMAMSFVHDLEPLVNFTGFVGNLTRCVALAAMIWIRIRNIPVHPKAIRMPLVLHIVYFLSCVFILVLPIYNSPLVSLIGFGAALSGTAVYLTLIWPKRKIQLLLKINDALTIVCQKIFNSAYEIQPVPLEPESAASEKKYTGNNKVQPTAPFDPSQFKKSTHIERY